MSTMDAVRDELHQRYDSGNNPYSDDVAMKRICNIDPASLVRACDTVIQILHLLTLNGKNQQSDLSEFNHS